MSDQIENQDVEVGEGTPLSRRKMLIAAGATSAAVWAAPAILTKAAAAAGTLDEGDLPCLPEDRFRFKAELKNGTWVFVAAESGQGAAQCDPPTGWSGSTPIPGDGTASTAQLPGRSATVTLTVDTSGCLVITVTPNNCFVAGFVVKAGNPDKKGDCLLSAGAPGSPARLCPSGEQGQGFSNVLGVICCRPPR